MREVIKRVTVILFLVLTARTSEVLGDIGVICTLNQELSGIVKFTNSIKDVSVAQRQFYVGKVNNTKLVIVRSPMGKVNNAITAQILLDVYKVSSLVSIGLAGSLQNSVVPGDVVGAVDSVQHDTGTIKPYGFIWGSATKVGNEPSNKLFIDGLKNSTSKFGKLVSGDQFISDIKKRDWLARKFNALAVDTNSAAIKQVCDQNAIPCGFIRVISDKSSINARQSFGDLARAKSVETVNVLKKLLDSVTR